MALGPKSGQHVVDLLQDEVIGIKRKKASAEQRRQKEFSVAKLQVIKAEAASEEVEEGEEEVGDKTGENDQ